VQILARPAARTHVARPGATAASTLGALGIVFGDIGTALAALVRRAAQAAAKSSTTLVAVGVFGAALFWFFVVLPALTLSYLGQSALILHGPDAAFGLVFLPVEGVFLAANLTKIDQGGWLPLAIGIGLYALMTTWSRGRAILAENRGREEGPLRPFAERLHAMDPPLPRVRGTCVFLNPSADTTPLALRANVEHNHGLHEQVLIVTARSANVPRVHPEDRVTVDDHGYTYDDITHVTARFGFQEEPDIPEALRLAAAKGLECDRSPMPRGWSAGASGCSSASGATRPIRSNTSIRPTDGRSPWAGRHRYE
jgi:KUP system potassium uptake protein